MRRPLRVFGPGRLHAQRLPDSSGIENGHNIAVDLNVAAIAGSRQRADARNAALDDPTNHMSVPIEISECTPGVMIAADGTKVLLTWFSQRPARRLFTVCR